MDLGGHSTADEAVVAALNAYIGHRKRQRLIELFGTIDFDPEYDYKEQRRYDLKKSLRDGEDED